MKYRVGEVCERIGLTPRQLREWGRQGLVTPARGPGNQRTYSDVDLATLRDVRRMREAGLGLADVKRVRGIIHGHALGAEAEGLLVLRGALTRMRAQLALADELAEALQLRLAPRTGTRPGAEKGDTHVR